MLAPLIDIAVQFPRAAYNSSSHFARASLLLNGQNRRNANDASTLHPAVANEFDMYGEAGNFKTPHCWSTHHRPTRVPQQ
jgi:hypothetical protein